MGDTRDRILDAVLAARDAGEEVDVDQLKRQFPDDAEEVERLVEAAARYARSVPGVEAPCDIGPGDRVGDFVVERLLGTGGMGHVFLARQQSLGQRRVALKVLPDALRNAANLRRFEREAVLLAELHHPRLSEVYGFGEEAGIQYIAMRYIEGRTLHSVLGDLASGLLNPTDRELQTLVTRWATDLSEALCVVHAADLVHHDVKPANVILETGADGRDLLACDAVLVDFGLVRAMDSAELTRTGHGAATPAYASPEQLLCLDTDPSSDVFSLGVTLHDLLARRLPRNRGSAAAGLEALTNLAPSIDADLAAVIGKMLDPDAQWRYPSAQPLLEDLRALRSGRLVSARFPPLAERVKRWVQHNPGRLLRVGAGIALLGSVCFLGTALLDSLSDAKRARAAWATGDVAELASLAGLLDVSGRWALGDSQLATTLEQLRAPAETTPTGRCATALAERHTDKALREAATPLRQHGIASDPFLARFLLFSLATEIRSDESGSSRGVEALRITARLFFERPVEQVDEQTASEPFREALLERWARPGLPLHERLMTISAFSGLGTVADVSWILAWAVQQPASSEELRLALRVSERILRRAIVMRDVVGIDQDTLQRVGLQAASNALHGETSPYATVRSAQMAAAEFAQVLGIYRRAAGLTPGLDVLLVEGQVDAALATNKWALALRAANRDNALAPILETGSNLPNQHATSYYTWGACCALMQELVEMPAVRKSMSAIVGSAEDADLDARVSSFERGFQSGCDLLKGIASQFDPDENTRLGAPGAADEWREVALERKAFDLDQQTPMRQILHWHYKHGEVHASGPIEAVHSRAIEQTMDVWSVGYGLMSQPGRSELRLRFRVDVTPELADWTLKVHYQLGARAYLPYQGEASFAILLDGRPLDQGRLRFVRDRDSHLVWLPRELMVPGEHVLSLRLGETTNTTFRLMGLEVLAPL